MAPPRLPRTAALIGGGAVGTVLLPALRTAGIRIVAAWNRTPRAPLWRGGPLPRAIREAELVLLSVADPAVAEVCRQLVEARVLGPGQLVVHVAGALDLSPLAPALEAGAQVGSLHPLRAVPPGSRADALAGAAAGIDGSDDDALERVAALAHVLTLKPMPVRGDRALYHAAAVLAAGAQVALFAEAQRAFSAATGADEAAARDALLPLARGALEAVAARGPAEALTGPAARGDAAAVSAHLRALERLGVDVAALYWLLSFSGVRLARAGNRAPPGDLDAVASALQEAGLLMVPSAGAQDDAPGHAHPHAHAPSHAHPHVAAGKAKATAKKAGRAKAAARMAKAARKR